MDLAYVAAVLEKEHEVLVIDIPNEGWEILGEMEGAMYRQGLKNEVVAERIKILSPNSLSCQFLSRDGQKQLS